MNIFWFFGFLNALDLIEVEPSIQCTIIEVNQKVKTKDLKDFPKIYQTISNDPATSRLLIANVELSHINPKVLLRTEDAETLSIEKTGMRIILELKGKPISRSGLLKINDRHIAKMTCH